MKYILGLILLFSSAAFAFRSANIVEILNGDLGKSSVTGVPIFLDQVALFSMQAQWGGSAVGFLNLQVSNDMGSLNPMGSGIVNWSNVTGSSAVISGASSDFSWNYSNIGYRWIRLIYTRASGAGTINARSEVKGD